MENQTQQNGLLASVASAAHTLLTSANVDQAVMRAADSVGRALDVDRICVFERHPHPQTEEALVSRSHEWRRDPSLCVPAPVRDISLQGNLPRWHELLSAGRVLEGLVRELPPPEKAFLEPLSTKSVLVVPIIIQERWAGFLCFHDCRRERAWAEDEKSILRTLAACVGGTLSRRQADLATRASVRKYRSLFETSRDGIVIADMEGRIEDANRAFLEMTGYGFEELAGRTYQQLTPVRWAKLDGDVLAEQVLKRGYCDEYEKEYIRRDGAVNPVSVRIWLVRDEQGRPSRMWRIVRDISERRRMEESLRASERQLRTLVDKLPVGVWLTDAQGKIVLCNPTGEGIWGGVRFSGIEQYGQYPGWWHGTGKRIQPHEWAPVRALSRGETYVNEIIDIETSDGRRKTVSHSAIPVRDDAGGITGIVVINEDITERKRAESRLRESEERHRRITQALSDYVYTVEVRDGRAVSTEHGAACEAVTGYTRDDLAANPYLWLRMVVEADKAAVVEQGRRLLAGEKPGPLEHRIVRKDGQTRWVRNTTVPHCDSEGKLLSYDGVIQDITDRKDAEDALRLSQFAMDHCAIPVFCIGPSGRFLYANEAAAQSLGYPREQLLYLGEADVNPDLAVDRWPPHWAQLKREKLLRWEGRHRRKDGRIFPVEITANYMEFGGREYDFAFVRDIGEQRQAQEKARESQEMLRLVLDHIPQRVFWKGRDFRYLGCNRNFLQDAGLQDACEILGKEDSELSWKEKAAAYRADDQAVMDQDRPKLDCEERQPNPGHDPRWIRLSRLPLHDKDAQVIGVLGTYEDVTEQRRAEEALRESETKYRIVADNTHDWEFWLSPAGEFLYVSPSCQRITGHAPKDFLADAGLRLRLVHPEDRARFESHVQDEVQHRLPGSIEFRIVRPDGEPRWISHVCQPVSDPTGRFLGTRSSNRDITERKAAEESLRFSQFALDRCSLPAYWADAQGRFQYVNDAACRAAGYAREELLALSAWDLDTGLPRGSWPEFWAQLRGQRSLLRETVVRAKDGRLFPVEVACSYLEHGGRERCFAFVQDITERRLSEERQGS
ncbi:MAG: PAS domain S-box protein [Elusimicrobia bacterium]|nr:PAS domain S-box protein [Elusimicrobiota bacterium]